jgi:hypothetical protein
MSRRSPRNAHGMEMEKRFPHRVDVVAPWSGFGRRVNDMQDWCFAEAGAYQVDWGMSHPPGKGVTRYCFAREDVAARFRERCATPPTTART